MTGKVVAGRKGVRFVLLSSVLGPIVAIGLMIGFFGLWGSLIGERILSGPGAIVLFFVKLLLFSLMVCAPIAIFLSVKLWRGMVISRRHFLFLSYFSAALSPMIVVTVLAGLDGHWVWAREGYLLDMRSMLIGLAGGMIFIGPFGLLSGGVVWWLGRGVGLVTRATESASFSGHAECHQ